MIDPRELRAFVDFAVDADTREWGPHEIWTIEEFFDVQL